MLSGRPKILVLNKMDLADATKTEVNSDWLTSVI